jgi:hypothetical protein
MSEGQQGSTVIDAAATESHDFWFSLVQKAMDRSPFDTLCTLLRPRGAHDAGWDVLDESQATFEDFNWMLKTAHEARGNTTARRLALHYYCFVIEMNPIHEMIMNLLRCISGQHYLPLPFWHLTRPRSKTQQWNILLPSMGENYAKLSNLRQQSERQNLYQNLNTCSMISFGMLLPIQIMF